MHQQCTAISCQACLDVKRFWISLNTIAFYIWISYLAGELRVDALDVSLSAIVLELHTDRSLQSYPDGPGHLFKGGDELFSLLAATARVEDGPDVQGNLRVRNRFDVSVTHQTHTGP